MKAIAEIIKSEYDEDSERIFIHTALMGVNEIDAPTVSYDGEEVDGLRWIREVNETFVGKDIEVSSPLITDTAMGVTELFLEDVSRFPNQGIVVINKGGATEESINYSYAGRIVRENKLVGIIPTTQVHLTGERVFPRALTDYLGTFELLLSHYPVRHSSVEVVLNGIETLYENKDFILINTFVGNNCVKSILRFFQGDKPRRFRITDSVEVRYQYFVQDINTISTYIGPGNLKNINVFENLVYEKRFELVYTIDREMESHGSIQLIPPVGDEFSSPSPVKIIIPNTEIPTDVILMNNIDVIDTTISLSSVSHFPVANTFIDAIDDEENRKILIGTNIISYEDVDTVENKLIGVTGITLPHSKDAIVELYDGARLIRDTVKNSINNSSLSSQIEAVSVDSGGCHLKIRCKIADKTFDIQPGTYNLSYLGFDDDIDSGLHEELITVKPFESKNYTFQVYREIIRRRKEAEKLLGQIINKRVSIKK